MAYDMCIGGAAASCHFSDSHLHIRAPDHDHDQETIDITDIIGFDTNTEEEGVNGEINIYIIKPLEDFYLKKETLTCTTSSQTCKEFTEVLRDKLDKLVERPRKLLVVISKLAGKQNGEQVYEDIISPLFKLAGISTEILVSESSTHIKDYVTAYDHDKVDGFVVCGGDGSYNQAFVPLLERAQTEAGIDLNDSKSRLNPTSKPIGFIPTGSGSANARFCNGCTDVETSTLNIIRGCKRQLGVCCLYSGDKYVQFCDVVAGFGLSTELFYYMESWRVLKTMRYLLVPFYFYLWKPIPLFNADITVYARPDETTAVQQVSGEIDPENKIELSGTFNDMLVFTQQHVLDKQYNMSSTDWKFDNSVLRLYKNTYTSRFELLKNFLKSMFTQGRRNELPHYVTKYEISGYRVKVQREDDYSTDGSYRLLLDSEYVQLQHPEWEFRYVPLIVKLETRIVLIKEDGHAFLLIKASYTYDSHTFLKISSYMGKWEGWACNNWVNHTIEQFLFKAKHKQRYDNSQCS